MQPYAFRGTDRFRLLQELGSGGMGVVYAAHDRERDEVIALKTLHWADASAIRRLKKEFRALADVSHPNLVCLYDLIAHDDAWFYTMELVRGVDFVAHVRGERGLDEGRLRASLRQLAEGIAAIHEAGKLHRDLKPSNVLVSPEGRVVILDLGICADVFIGEDQLRTVEEGILGTVQYMAPEQGSGTDSAAMDWYACGVILYEALTGALPFTGTAWQVVLTKQMEDAPSPEARVQGLPPDLVGLCTDLMKRDPTGRPGGDEVLRRLGAAPAPRWRSGERDEEAEAVLVGRERHFAALADALEATQRGEPMWANVHGPSGIGKSTLVRQFADQARRRGAAVLAGRCYEREDVPYKGLDGVIDGLTHLLGTLPAEEARRLIPRDVPALALIFPVLERVEAIAWLEGRQPVIGDPVELRRRAFAALRALLKGIALGRPLLLHVDDLQWADADTVLLLEGLVAPPDPPAALVIASFRSEEIEARAFLRGWLEPGAGRARREIEVGALTEAETRRLAGQLLGSDLGPSQRQIEAIVRESAGSPFLVEQLVQHLALVTMGREAVGIGLADMLRTRVSQLPPSARAFLETLAVAARPIDTVLARDAAGITGDERPLVARLRAEHLVRSSGSTQQVELYHDRIRETVAAGIAPERLSSVHQGLADAMVARGIDDPESLCNHCLGSGRRDRAAHYAMLAAERANAALAFERAIGLFHRALDLAPEPAAERLRLRAGLGDALANAGRGPDAARVFLEAAAAADATTALDLRRRAAEQLLRSGHLDEGLLVVSGVLQAVGLRYPRSRLTAIARTLLRRAWLRVRGLGFTDRGAAEPGAAEAMIRRIDVCWAVAVGLARIDHLRASDFQTRHLVLALKLGDPYRAARALSVEATFRSISGRPAEAGAMRMLRETQELAERIHHPHAIGTNQLGFGMASFYCGHFAAAREHCETAERILREQCTGVAWEIVTAQTYFLSALCYLGEYGELARRVPRILREAIEHGDLYAAADVGGGRSSLAWLALDDVDGARDAFRYAVGPGSGRGFASQLAVNLLAQGQIDLYAGEPDAAWGRVVATWPALVRSMLLRIQVSRVEALHLRARSALASAVAAGSTRQARLRSAERDARRILRERLPWSDPLGHLVLAATSALRGEVDAAAELLDRAAAGFASAGMAGYAAAAHRRRGVLIGGDEGGAIVASADAWMGSQGVVSLERLTAMLAPGFPV